MSSYDLAAAGRGLALLHRFTCSELHGRDYNDVMEALAITEQEIARMRRAMQFDPTPPGERAAKG